MPLRSGKKFLKHGTSDPPTPSDVAGPHPYARSIGIARVSTRTRSSSDISAVQHGPDPDTQAYPAHKRPRHALPWLSGTVGMKLVDSENVIDLTLDDDSPKDDDGHTSWPAPREPKRTRNGRGERRSGRPAANKRVVDVDSEGRNPKDKSKDQTKEQFATPQWLRNTHNKIKWGTVEVMFTMTEAILYLERRGQGITPSSKPAYNLSTGEYIPFPVTISYHLDGMGRFDARSPHCASENSRNDALGQVKFPPPKAPRSMMQAAYVFDWGKNCGKSILEVNQLYTASILASSRLAQLLEARKGLREALRPYAPRILASSAHHLRCSPERFLCVLRARRCKYLHLECPLGAPVAPTRPSGPRCPGWTAGRTMYRRTGAHKLICSPSGVITERCFNRFLSSVSKS
jgi:hypothetical protein